MTNEQMNALRKIEQMLKEGKITPMEAHARRNAIGAGMSAYREQYPEESQVTAPAKSSVVNKMKMPAAPEKEEQE